MSIASAIIVTIIAILFSGFFSGSEIAYVQSSKVRMEIDATRGGFVDRILHLFSRHEDMFISTLLVGNNVVLVIYGITVSILINPTLERWFGGSEAAMLLSNTVISTLIILITGEFLPKVTFRINPNFTMRLLSLPLFIIYIILYPVSLFVSAISKGLMRLFRIKGEAPASGILTIDQLDDYLQQQLERKETADDIENEVKIFRNAIDFKDTQMAQCMIPRNEITAVNIDTTTREQLLQTFISTGLSKIVVYREDIDDIVGYIHIDELFKTDSDWKKHLKPVIFTPETMLANKMMRRMLAQKKSLVIVVDEFGGTAGLATLEDLVEEIFGEIEDEHDKSKLIARQLDENNYEFSGRAEIEYINEHFHLDIRESDEYHTIAGYILENLESLPVQGDSFRLDNLQFRVLKMSATRILLLSVTRLDDDTAE